MNIEFLNKVSKLMFEIDVVKASVKRATLPIEIGKYKVDLDVEGTEIEIPRWASDKLVNKGIIELKIEELSLKDIRKILWKESRESNLTKIDPQFYVKAKQKIQKIINEIQKEPTPEKIQEKRGYESTFMDIINCRIQKILQLAMVETVPPNILENMTIEEKMLLTEIKQVILTWKEQLRGE
ncbi:MAG: DNA replication complex GINS family protein [Candidatus Methanomethylicia archaeon]|nr:DNA replication complex GINS family protein [Candidatus Methanomethylicia archaeon]MCX8168983.1 DNA replication complex GINS family protein [Candidatus Methanomethylicia archaeon]MDW7988715.1 hypothetical protein [Nitrososphaerota archaeon]